MRGRVGRPYQLAPICFRRPARENKHSAVLRPSQRLHLVEILLLRWQGRDASP